MSTTGHRVERPGDGLAMVVLDRPDRRNAFTPSTMLRLTDDLHELAEDPLVRAVVVTGANRAFSAGADLGQIDEAAAMSKPVLRDLLDRIMRVAEALWAMPQPTIAAIDGAAAGGGMALALACDIRVAAPDAVLVAPFIHMGMVPDCGISWMLPRLVGEGTALEILLTGRPVDAARGAQLGLFTRVQPDPVAAALEIAATVARRPAEAARATKALLREVAGGTLSQAITHEAHVQTDALHGPEFAEAVGPWRTSRRAD
ncbi:enoyl-CoA hydratase/isomerase family protein [Pseudonocardia spinosispora]|uniref:enoyl-CoA hydratase/isomerase family protein n=1 Tax=Pseudonocardia spinosispora TaxID=103441 RepID=UPI00048D61AD|nr:enoyl-CoA hydratase-related protein [Pseudonocardia spinosispora]